MQFAIIFEFVSINFYESTILLKKQDHHLCYGLSPKSEEICARSSEREHEAYGTNSTLLKSFYHAHKQEKVKKIENVPFFITERIENISKFVISVFRAEKRSETKNNNQASAWYGLHTYTISMKFHVS